MYIIQVLQNLGIIWEAQNLIFRARAAPTGFGFYDVCYSGTTALSLSSQNEHGNDL